MALQAAADEVRAQLQVIKGLDTLPSWMRIDALRELSDSADDLAWSLAQPLTPDR
jgi:hypothetical protein